jgi:hypothetical protein
MKTFSTSGTGSGQTLSEIESDKMPIYNSVADVEADLANLEEGQIVATKDTGTELSQPVDVVEEGNLHAVTSNAVFNCFNFQRGVIDISTMSPNTTQTEIVTFDTPFIDNEYSICLSWVDPSNGERVIYTTDSKTTTGFKIYLRALDTVTTLIIEWQAFRIPH